LSELRSLISVSINKQCWAELDETSIVSLDLSLQGLFREHMAG